MNRLFRVAAVIVFGILFLVVIARPGPSTSSGSDTSRVTIARSGERDQVSDRFTLSGDYRLDWTASDTGNTSVGCSHFADLEPGSVSIAASPDGGGKKSGSSFAYGLRGQYHFEVISGCAWTLSLVPV